MNYEYIRQSLAKFDQFIHKLGMTIGCESPVSPQFELTREFLQDEASLTEEEVLAKWKHRFKEFYDAQIVVKRLTDAVMALTDQPEHLLRSRLKQVLADSLTQDFVPTQVKDFFFELELASFFKERGFKVELSEPDIVVSENGLGQPLGIACKYPSSEHQIHPHLSKGYNQIRRQHLMGLVAIGLDQIVFRSMGKFIDFRQGTRHPLEIMQAYLRNAVANLVIERDLDYPSEPTINGLLLTLGAGGLWGSPAQLTIIRAITIQCDHDNPRISDIQILYRGLVAGEAEDPSTDAGNAGMEPKTR